MFSIKMPALLALMTIASAAWTGAGAEEQNLICAYKMDDVARIIKVRILGNQIKWTMNNSIYAANVISDYAPVYVAATFSSGDGHLFMIGPLAPITQIEFKWTHFSLGSAEVLYKGECAKTDGSLLH